MNSPGKGAVAAYALISIVMYIASDIVTKRYLRSTVLDISLVRFALGAPLVYFATRKIITNPHAIGFAAVNTLNSLAGVFALTSGSLVGFALASQMRPLFVASFAMLFFGLRSSLKNIALLIGAFLISAFTFSNATGLLQPSNLYFVVTVALQSASFAAFGQQHTGKDLLAFTGLYNFVGLLICVSLKIASDEASFDFDGIGLNLCNGLIALGGSIFVLLSYKSPFKVQTAAIQYLRLPVTLCLAFVLFSEEITLRIVIGSAVLLAIAYEITTRPVSDTR
jgi:hypothetical protein